MDGVTKGVEWIGKHKGSRIDIKHKWMGKHKGNGMNEET